MIVHRYKFTNPPPSLNNSKVPQRRGNKTIMVSSKRYQDWQAEAGAELMSQRGKLPDPCYWSSEILIPASKSKADLDNLLKPIHDLLVKHGRVPDDRYKVSVRARFWKGDHVVVAIKLEEIAKWAIIKNASKSMLKRLEQALPWSRAN